MTGLDIVLDDTLPDGTVLTVRGGARVGPNRAVMHPAQAARMGLPVGRHALRVPWWRRLWRRLAGQR